MSSRKGVFVSWKGELLSIIVLLLVLLRGVVLLWGTLRLSSLLVIVLVFWPTLISLGVSLVVFLHLGIRSRPIWWLTLRLSLSPTPSGSALFWPLFLQVFISFRLIIIVSLIGFSIHGTARPASVSIVRSSSSCLFIVYFIHKIRLGEYHYFLLRFYLAWSGWLGVVLTRASSD